VNGKPRHSQSQGSVERANRDIEEMLATWMSEKKADRSKWSAALRFVQYMKNSSLHAGIKQSPYEAMFRTAPKIGLEHTAIPQSVWHLIQDEDDLLRLVDKVDSNSRGVKRPLDDDDDDDESMKESCAEEDVPDESTHEETVPADSDLGDTLDQRKSAILGELRELELPYFGRQNV